MRIEALRLGHHSKELPNGPKIIFGHPQSNFGQPQKIFGGPKKEFGEPPKSPMIEVVGSPMDMLKVNPHFPFTIDINPDGLARVLRQKGWDEGRIQKLRIYVLHHATAIDDFFALMNRSRGGSVDALSGDLIISVYGMNNHASHAHQKVTDTIDKKGAVKQGVVEAIQNAFSEHIFFPDAEKYRKKKPPSSQMRKDRYIKGAREGVIPPDRAKGFLATLAKRYVTNKLVPEVMTHELKHYEDLRGIRLKGIIAFPVVMVVANQLITILNDLSPEVYNVVYDQTHDSGLASMGAFVVRWSYLPITVSLIARLRGILFEKQAYKAGQSPSEQLQWKDVIHVRPLDSQKWST